MLTVKTNLTTAIVVIDKLLATMCLKVDKVFLWQLSNSDISFDMMSLADEEGLTLFSNHGVSSSGMQTQS